MTTAHFGHLKSRCGLLLAKYIDPQIAAIEAALADGDVPPDPDFDNMAACRLLIHSELECYFENRALDSIKACEGQSALTMKNASLIALRAWMERREIDWQRWVAPPVGVDKASFASLANEAHGFARQFIKANNGIKEKSVQTLSAIMGYFPDELDGVLVEDLNKYGSLRGTVAHNSWVYATNTFESPEIERGRVDRIIGLIEQFYEA
ncbi:hypothetical protein K1516_09995 [Stenotrophomonas maltophilia]|uniref:hypothetical protein n=1 Tax=Stenotrophomonas maltophilia TaxID=40324 RepID=UPI00200D7EC7|nr:hypothetical protein [Stenotrophomonas maltophilia]UQA72411.1 hypothetical protein K1516_09995 [Stenotrophomonas maltophilia]